MSQVDWWNTTTTRRREHLEKKLRMGGKGSAAALGKTQ